MRILLRDLSPGQDYAVQFQSSNSDGVTSDWSPVYRFRTSGDIIAPQAPSGLTWVPTGSSFLGKWNPVTIDGDGSPLKDLKDYEVIVSSGAVSRAFYVSSTSFELTLLQNQQIFGEIASTVTIVVRARDFTLNKSSSVTATATEDNPPVPSTPTITYLRGQIVVNWNGNPASGVRNDLTLNHVEIHASTTNNFTPSASTLRGRFEGTFPGTQSYILTDLTYDVPIHIKLVAVNRMGRKSDPSGQAIGTPTRLSGLDIGNGEISVDQINFADQLGGVRAFYEDNPPEPPTFDPVAGDIWYDTNDAYKPYKRVNGAWVYDPNINMISGSRIVAGTITADQIGTNLILTSAANIADAVIDSAKISSLSGDKIVAGQIQSSSMVSYGGGSPRPAFALNMNGDMFINSANVRGDLVIGNAGDTSAVKAASLVRSFDYIANTAGWAIKGDGTVEFNNGTFRGSITGASIVGSIYKTATSGRRIEMGSTGQTISRIEFIAPNGTRTEIGSFTGGVAATEVIRLGVVDDTVSQFWKKMQIQSDGGINTWSAYNHVVIGGGGTGQQDFSISTTPDKGTPQNPFFTETRRFTLDTEEFYLNDKSGALRLYLQSDGTNRIFQDDNSVAGAIGTIFQQWTSSARTAATDRLWLHSDGSNFIWQESGGTTVVHERQANGDSAERFAIEDDRIRLRPTALMLGNVNAAAYIEIIDRLNGNTSPQMKFLTAFHNGVVYGGMFRYAFDLATLTNERMEMVNLNSSGYLPLWAASFVQNSDEAGKKDIHDLPGGQKEIVRKLQSRRFTRKQPNEIAEVETSGFVAQEVQRVLPEAVLDGGEGAGLAIDWSPILASTIAAVGEMADDQDSIVEALKKISTRLDLLEKKRGKD